MILKREKNQQQWTWQRENFNSKKMRLTIIRLFILLGERSVIESKKNSVIQPKEESIIQPKGKSIIWPEEKSDSQFKEESDTRPEKKSAIWLEEWLNHLTMQLFSHSIIEITPATWIYSLPITRIT